MNDHFQQLLHYIHFHVSQGAHPAHVRQALVGAGWDDGMVDGAMHHLGLAPQPQPLRQPAVQDAPHKYKVFKAIGDTCKSAKANPGNLTLGVLISVAISVSLQILLTAFLVGTLATIGGVSGLSSLSIGMIVLYIAAFVIGTGLAQAFMQGIIANSIYDGADGRLTTFGQLFSKSTKDMLRIFRATLLAAAMLCGPLIGGALLMALLAFTGGTPSLIIGLLVGICGSVWLLIAAPRYVLAPYVAMFEDDIPVRKSLARSKHLMLKGGQWFLFKGGLLLVALFFFAAFLTVAFFGDSIRTDSSFFDQPAFIFAMGILQVFLIGCLTMLYRNRSIIRGQA